MSTDAVNDSSPSWLRQRTSVFNNTTTESTTKLNNSTTPPVVKKELASLKKIGAVSSVWSNKFVQSDNSGDNKRTPTHPLQPLSLDSPPRRLNKMNISPRPNADYVPAPGTRQSFSNSLVQQPTTPLFEKSRAKSMSDDIRQTVDQHQPQQHHRIKQKSLGYFSKTSMPSLDLNDIKDSNRSSSVSSCTSNGFSSPPLRTSTETDRTCFAKNDIDEAAALWFQCETLKTQYAQNNARLNKATEDVVFYKRQLEQQGEISRQGIADAVEEKQKEVVRVRQLAQLIVKQDELLDEYQLNLDILTQSANESAFQYSEEIKNLRQELESFKKQKELLEDKIAALQAELEMNAAHGTLVMTVSTEIQKDFQTYKNKINFEIKQKQVEHETMLEQLAVAPTTTTTTTTDSSITDTREKQDVQALYGQINSLTEALEEKDRVVVDLESQLESQKMSMDSQMMELNRIILEKDAVIAKLMGSYNNNSTNMLAPQQQPENRLQMSQIRDSMYDTSDDEEENEKSNTTNYHQLMTHENMTLQSASSSVRSTVSFESSDQEEKVAEIKHFSYSSVQSQQTRMNSTESLANGQDMMADVSRRLDFDAGSTNACFSATKENTGNWPMPPPTPPPSEPLPTVPAVSNAADTAITTPTAVATDLAQEKKQEDLQQNQNITPPPRRARSKTMSRDEVPNMSIYTTSIHQTNQFPRIIPLERDVAPVPPPRKDVATSVNIQQQPHTKWMDDPESEEDDAQR